MTTISSTSSTPAAAPASKPAPAPYDGKAAVAKAQAQAATAIAAQNNSVLNQKLTDLPTTVIDLLQSDNLRGNDLVNALFSSSANNAINNQLSNSLTQTALAAAAYKRGQVATQTSPLDKLITNLIKANTSA